MKKKLTFLAAFLCCVAAANADANYPTGGMTPLMDLIAKMDPDEGPRGDAAWPWIGANGDHIWHSQPDYGVFGAMMYNTAFGIYASSDIESDGKTLKWATCKCGKYATLRGIDWTGKNYLQKEGSENNIVFATKANSWHELYFLEFLRLSGNRFRNISIVGHVSETDSLVNLKEVDLSGNDAMEYFSINGAPNLVTLKVNAATVEIAGSTLLFSKMADIQATTLNYTPTGTVHLTFPSNLVDLSAEAAIATTFSNWSATPTADNNGLFSFDESLVGQTLTVELANANYSEWGTITANILLTAPFYVVDTNISTAEKLDSIRYNPTGEYTLTADIDLAAYIADRYPEQGWLPIGNATTPFSGKLIGNGHVISGLWCKRDTFDYVGLFGTLGYCRDIKTGDSSTSVVGDDQTPGAEISNLAIIADSIVGQYNVGALAGIAGNKSHISGVYVKADVLGNTNVGGICGTFYGKNVATLIEDCYVAGSVAGQNKVGGVAGNAFNQEAAVSMNRIYTTNTVRNIGSWYLNTTGGFVGRLNGWYGMVKYHNCFAINDSIDGFNPSFTGRFAGGWVDQCSSTASTLYKFADNAYGLDVMEFNNTEDNVYKRLLPSDTGEDGLGEEYQILNKRNKHGFNLTAAQLKQQETYEASGWDFTDTWTMGNGDYPLPVLKNINVAKQPSAYPAYLDAKPVYTVTLALDSTGVTGLPTEAPISLHVTFPYWEKKGILDGTDVPVYIRPYQGSELESLIVNDVDKTSEIVNNIYTIRAIAGNTLVVGKFRAPTGIGYVQSDAIGIYPNPTTGKISVNNKAENSTLRIYDITGNERLKSNESTLDISHLANGVYFVKVAGRVTKIVKK
ncbi:MAG: T9SS type A sorting domain-containing protein [Candidatus Symbiothrix sp.]|jgi:hypothetical protein|nr:T9SS type A sorting domain-containing protein [Candidatus Symbiothrix sp.]